MLFTKNRRHSYSLLILFALVMLLTPILTGFALANNQVQNEKTHQCSACDKKEMVDFAKDKFGIKAEILSDSLTEKYIKTVEKSIAFKNQEFTFSDNVKAVQVKPLDIIQLFGPTKNNDNTVISAFLDGATGKVISVTTMTWDGLKDDSNVNTVKYLENGNTEKYNNSWEELKIKSIEKEQKLKNYMSNGGSRVAATGTDDFIMVAIDWEYWACQFASVTACGLGCLVFVEIPPLMATCDLMCQQIWSANLC